MQKALYTACKLSLFLKEITHRNLKELGNL